MLRSYYAGRLDLATAVMRARQGIAEASRNLEGLYDRQRTDVASELQVEQANLDQLKLKRDTTQKQLLDALSKSDETDTSHAAAPLVFTVNRRVNGNIEELTVSENTVLQPGDVVRVTRPSTQLAVASPARLDAQPETSQ
jgi:polysaccharide export outer membrane protein